MGGRRRRARHRPRLRRIRHARHRHGAGRRPAPGRALRPHPRRAQLDRRRYRARSVPKWRSCSTSPLREGSGARPSSDGEAEARCELDDGWRARARGAAGGAVHGRTADRAVQGRPRRACRGRRRPASVACRPPISAPGPGARRGARPWWAMSGPSTWRATVWCCRGTSRPGGRGRRAAAAVGRARRRAPSPRPGQRAPRADRWQRRARCRRRRPARTPAPSRGAPVVAVVIEPDRPRVARELLGEAVHIADAACPARWSPSVPT